MDIQNKLNRFAGITMSGSSMFFGVLDFVDYFKVKSYKKNTCEVCDYSQTMKLVFGTCKIVVGTCGFSFLSSSSKTSR